MKNDEQMIRDLIATWMEATKAGDTAKVLSLMTDDVVFLIPGQPVVTKAGFAAASAKSPAGGGLKIESASDIQEIKVLGDWAFMWTKLKVVVTPPNGAAMTRAGHTLTVLQKVNGHWLLARDANLLAPVK